MTYAKRQPRQPRTPPAAKVVRHMSIFRKKGILINDLQKFTLRRKNVRLSFFMKFDKLRRLQVRVQTHGGLFLLIDMKEPPRVPLVRIFTPHLGEPDFRYIDNRQGVY